MNMSVPNFVTLNLDWHSQKRSAAPRRILIVLSPAIMWLAPVLLTVLRTQITLPAYIYIPSLVIQLYWYVTLFRVNRFDYILKKHLHNTIIFYIENFPIKSVTSHMFIWERHMRHDIDLVLFHKKFWRLFMLKPALDLYPVPVQTFFDWLPQSAKDIR